MIRKLSILTVLVTGLSLGSAAMADHDNGWKRTGYSSTSRYDYARVTNVEPLVRTYRVKRPRQECWEEERYRDEPRYRDRPRRRHHSTAGATVAGGIIGGVLGNQFGDGNGRKAMTLVGTLIGGAIGHDVASKRHRARDRYYDYEEPVAYTVQRCNTTYIYEERERIEGYLVTYKYRGRTFTTRTDSDPGRRIRVRVSVTPVGGLKVRDA